MRRALIAGLLLCGCSPAGDAPAVPSVVVASASVSAPAPSMPVSAAFLAEHASSAAKGPAGVTLVARTRGGQRRFAMGERIVLELSFTSDKLDAYELDMGTYDRTGRLWSERFDFDPASKVADPLADYFGQAQGGLGGIRAVSPKLTQQPTRVEVVLNEWARFDEPGTYRFFVRSTRVEAPGLEDAAVSNVVELEVVSNPVWADGELARIRAVLDGTTRAEAREEARTALRFLTTPAAARAMAADLCKVPGKDDESRWSTRAGLFGSPDRAAVIRLLEDGLLAADCAVDAEYLATVARLRSAPHGASSDADARAMDDALDKLIDALPKKSDAARATSLQAALGEVASRRNAISGPRAEALRQGLGRVLGQLPEAALVRLLGDQWPLARSPSLAAPLLALAGEARPRGGLRQSVSDLALQRLVEVDAERARTFILAEIGRAGGARVSFSGATLGLLKERELPGLDAALANGLRAPERDGISLEMRAELFARYASRAMLTNAWVAYREVPFFRVSLLSYLARHDAKAAETEIRSIQDFHSLDRLSRFLYDGTVEALVIQRLGMQEASGAASLLAERGTVTAKKALWARLQALTSAGQRQTADAIRNAIVYGNGWLTTPDELRSLAAMCPDAGCKQQVEYKAARWGPDGKRPALVLWSTTTAGGVTGSVAHCDVRSVAELQARIAQLPAGVTLEWQTTPADVDVALMDDVRKWAKVRRVQVAARP